MQFRGKVWIGIILITIVLWSLLLVGCKAKVSSVNTHTTDTIYKSEVIKIDKPQLSEIFIENVCDSLGNLKTINYISVSDNTRTTLKSDNNNLILSVNIDSIVNSKVNEYKSSLKAKETVLVKYKNKKIMWYSLSLNVLLIGYILRKPLLKLLTLL